MKEITVAVPFSFCPFIMSPLNRLENLQNMYSQMKRDDQDRCTFCKPSSSSSRICVMNHNWSAMKQRLRPQSVAEISRHSVLSGGQDSTM